jgi:chaperonin GroES
MEEWVKITAQFREEKSFPWPGAANIKYPLISTASMQFSARAYPSLVPGDGKVVKSRIYGKDPTGEKALKADRVSTYMNFQTTYDMPYWEEEMDKMLMSLAVFGMMYKKTFYDTVKKKIHSRLVYPADLIVDYWAKSLEDAERISEILYLSPRDVESRKKSGAFKDIKFEEPTNPELNVELKTVATSTTTPPASKTTPYQFIEQHTWLDIDDDGIFEPYVVTFHYRSGKVARITARFSDKDIVVGEDDKIVAFEPIQYYTKFGFIPNPDGSFYDLGFGALLGPLNEAVNTLVNQLVDSGTLNNLQSGWIGKGLRMKMGEANFKPGEWKVVNAVGDDIRKQLVPLPAREPSKVLFELLGMLVTSGKELASVAEIFTGKLPGQNTPATTTQETIEQGMKVFTAIYKRVYRSLEKEFKKIYRLNKIYLQQPKYVAVLDTEVSPNDFDEASYDICPAADPTASTQTEKLQKAMALGNLLQLGTIDPMEVTIRILQAQEQPNWEKLIPGMVETGKPTPPQQPPDPKIVAAQQKAELDGQKAQLDMASKQQEMEMNQRSKEMELMMKAQENQLALQSKAQQANLDNQSAQAKYAAQMQQAKGKMMVQDAQHQQKMRQTQEAEKLASNKSSGSGKTTRSRK